MKRILVVDDDSSMRLILKRFLEREGFSVDEAKDGEEGLSLLRVHAYNLIITDLVMPGKTGFEMLEELKELHPGAKVIAFSGGGVAGAEACLDIARQGGAARTFAKPFDMAELLDAVKELV